VANHQMKDWEIIADNLSAAGWSWGCVTAIDANGQTIWIADAHRGDGQRFGVRADEKLRAFVELQAAIHRQPGSSQRPTAHAPPDAQLSALALHLPTPRATGQVE
jgi:hypothetical protein